MEKRNEATQTTVQPNEQEGSPKEAYPASSKWSEEFECDIVNGVLAPVPLSVVPVHETGGFMVEELSEAPSRKRHRGSASKDVGATEGQQQQQQASSSKKKRKTEGNEELVFKLFKFANAGEQYLLEVHQVKTGGIDRWQLLVYEAKQKWKVGVYDLAQGDHTVVPVLEDPKPLLFHKNYQVSLQERLVGWTVEKRKRSNGKEDTFYYHGGRQFRSFVETTAFILYSSKPKDLKHTSNNVTSQEAEAEAIEAMMKISSGNNDIGNSSDIVKENINSSADLAAGIELGNNSLEAREKTDEADHKEMENEFVDYNICNIFEDEAPQSMIEIFGEPKH
ncbi:hypothetical protein Salat_2319500 [Sesamum alatum]|uniref:Uncharacterized protein n=1 Tax=Sesamum alatum TaxID=300844 RepID=A0AAE1XWT1_9LAMI|nr:hypothetical protein Salat_2319500 [Sesamum alatum]